MRQPAIGDFRDLDNVVSLRWGEKKYLDVHTIRVFEIFAPEGSCRRQIYNPFVRGHPDIAFSR